MYNTNEELLILSNGDAVIKSTGELLTGFTQIFEAGKQVAYEEMKDSAIKQQKSIDKLKRIDKDNSEIFSVGGYYYHLLFKNVLKEELEENYVIRFCKLCTHLNFNNVLVNNIVDGRKRVLEGDLQEILKLSLNETIRTKKYLVENELVFIDEDGVITINKKYAIRGKVKGNSDMTRLFINGFNELYDGVSARQHKQLAIFIKILPYLNSEYNILCDNPDEKDKRLVRPINWMELAERIGLEKKQAYNLKTKLFKLRINDKKVIAEWKDSFDVVKLVINPAIFWKANESNISEIANLFDI